MSNRASGVDAASWILTLGQFGLAGAIAFFGPNHPVPLHFNIDGEVDRWGSRAEPALVVLFLAVISVAIMTTRGVAGRNRYAEVGRGMAMVQFGVLLVLSMVALLEASLTLGLIDHPGPRFGMATIGVILAFVGALLGKTTPNALIGVRTPWTFGSRLAWDKANRLAGRLFFWGGLTALIAAPFAPQPLGFQVLHISVLASAVLVVFESWRVWFIDPDRRKGGRAE